MNIEKAKKIAEKITIATVNRTFGYEYDEMYCAIVKAIDKYCKETKNDPVEKTEYCIWEKNDSLIFKYLSSCGYCFQGMTTNGICYCSKPIKIKEPS